MKRSPRLGRKDGHIKRQDKIQGEIRGEIKVMPRVSMYVTTWQDFVKRLRRQ